jgi:hypothetical protein
MPRPSAAPAPSVVRILLLALTLLFSTLQGCAASPWEANYEGAAGAPLPPNAPIQLREVSWDRLQSGLKDLEAEQAKSDVHPADWPAEKKAQFNERLLKILQVSDTPAQVEILGRSAFRTTSPRIPDRDPDISAFARKIGASKVAWSRRLVGRAEEIVQEPVTTFGTTYYDRGGRRRGPSYYTESYTTWVPVAVQSDEDAYVAYFLRAQGG